MKDGIKEKLGYGGSTEVVQWFTEDVGIPPRSKGPSLSFHVEEHQIKLSQLELEFSP